jgi:Predicted ATPase
VLNIDIVDYPGEWLLDLPLLDLTYEAWSAKMLRLTEREPRRRLADQWLAAVASAKPAGPVDESEIRRLAEVYRQYLKASAEPALGLTLIQPGRFSPPAIGISNPPPSISVRCRHPPAPRPAAAPSMPPWPAATRSIAAGWWASSTRSISRISIARSCWSICCAA